eukprot:g54088.t1
MDLDTTSVLRALEGNELHFQNLHQRAERDGVASLQGVKQHFSKLKMDYQALESQQALLDALVKRGVNGSNRDTQRLEELVKENKANIKLVKKETATVKKELQDTIRTLVQRWKELKIQKMEFTQNFDQENTRRNQLDVPAMQARNENENVYGKVSAEALDQMSLEKCERVLVAQRAEVQGLSQELEKLEATVGGLEQDLTSRTSALETGEKIVRQALQTEQREAPERNLLTKKTAWAEWVREALGPIHSFEILHNLQAEPHTLCIAFQGSSSQLRLELSRDLTRFLAAKLEPPTVNISDIVEYALETQSLPFLVREVRSRLSVAALHAFVSDDTSAAELILSSTTGLALQQCRVQKHFLVYGVQNLKWIDGHI